MPTTDLLKTFGLSRNPFTDRTAGQSKMSRGIVMEAAVLVPILRRRLGSIRRRRAGTA
jgi:hypothetical protein